jgi:hypothetical protein
VCKVCPLFLAPAGMIPFSTCVSEG